MTRTSTSTAIYTGKDLPGVQGTGESLPTGAVVRVISTSAHLGAAVSLVDLPSTAFGTGRTYTVWSVPASSLEEVAEAVRAPRGTAFACGTCYVAVRPGEYEPDGGPWGACAICGDQTQVHRVSWGEADFLRSSLAEVLPA